MPRFAFPRSPRFSLLVGATSWLLVAGALSGCPGSLDPSIMSQAGTGGTTGTGGGNGTGGSTSNCTGDNDGATIVTNSCAGNTGCHVPNSPLGAGLDLTPDSGIASRLLGVTSKGVSPSMCAGNSEPYLKAGSNPASGLLIDKLGASPPCGVRMPYLATALTATQQECLTEWATSITSM